MRIGKYILWIFVVIFSTAATHARDYEPEEITNPNIANRYDYVADPEHRLDSDTEARVNARLQALRDSTTAEVAVAVVPSIGDYTIEDFSEKVFSHWKLGMADKDNGVLLLISPDSRQVRIQTGYGAEGVLPDIVCRQIIDRAIIPNMQQDCLGCAVEDATAMISEIMTNPDYAEELRSNQADGFKTPVNRSFLLGFVGFVVLCVFMFAAIGYFLDLRKTKKTGSSGEKTLLWKDALTTYGVLAAISLGTALPFYLLALYHYRHARYGSHPCPNCGGKTYLVKGTEAMSSLTPSQQFEEKLGSVEYDVRKCRKCGNSEVIPFINEKSPYKKCPHCGTRAYHFTGANQIHPPTYQQDGYGVKRYRCEYCGNNDESGYRIPKKDMSGAIAAAAILGAAGSGRRGGGGNFGGGSFGGGFGGGMTGGGGASGRW